MREESRWTEGTNPQELLLPVSLKLAPSGVDTGVDGANEIGSDVADVFVGLGRLLIEQLGRLEQDRGRRGGPGSEDVLRGF